MEVSVKRCSMRLCLVFMFFDIVNGLKCFECTLSEYGCDNPTLYNNISSIDCSKSVFTIRPDQARSGFRTAEDKQNYQCLTTIEKNATHRLFTRRCALKSEGIICDISSRNDNDFVFEKCSLCERDFCNSSNVLKINVIYYYLLLLGLVMLYK
uniref:Uncharacterized protein LOC114329688 n=1 Tax=Diabrotica virgifera virgifera TaxID=50390 RepID=A0A6P7FFS7_DIAVI